MARAVAVLEVCGVAQAVGVCQRRARFVRARGSRDPGVGAVSPASPAIRTAPPARLAASLGRADGRSGPDRPFPLSLLRAAAERALSAVAGDPDLGRIPGVRLRPRARRGLRSDVDPAAGEHCSAGSGEPGPFPDSDQGVPGAGLRCRSIGRRPFLGGFVVRGQGHAVDCRIHRAGDYGRQNRRAEESRRGRRSVRRSGGAG